MVPAPRTASNLRSIPMHLTQVTYGGCWKCPQLWQRCSSRTPRLAASQNGFVHSFGTGTGLVTLLQSLIRLLPSHLRSLKLEHYRRNCISLSRLLQGRSKAHHLGVMLRCAKQVRKRSCFTNKLVSRFRSSSEFAARSVANFGIAGH